MPTEIVLGLVLMGSLTLYVLMGGADFGGGVWDLFASGPRKQEQRALIASVISPIWETNHVWLILTVVVLFSAFPKAFAAISIALHVPLTLFLVGVVFRGSAFTFRTYDARDDRTQQRWGLIFSLTSLISPILLGMIVGAIASGRIRYVNGAVVSGFFAAWLNPFSFVVGLFALSLFAFLAATYLTNEASTPALVEDFRKRAIVAGLAVGSCALLAFALSSQGSPRIRAGLTDHPLTWPLHAVTAAAATTAFCALFRRWYRLARVAVIVQTTMILLGWAASQYPYLLVPDLTLAGAAANPRTQRLVLGALAVGSVVLLPSLILLFRIFRQSNTRRAG
jgi:cytochrome d ubiquinol oxidase subunit II